MRSSWRLPRSSRGSLTRDCVVDQFIDDHRDRLGAEPICRVLTEHGCKIAPCGYYTFRERRPSAWALLDTALVIEIERVFWDSKSGRGISGDRSVWHLLQCEGIVVARCAVERLMRGQRLCGVRRGKQFIAIRADSPSFRQPDHVPCCFRADRPNELWVVDLTYVPTWSGMKRSGFGCVLFERVGVCLESIHRSFRTVPLGWFLTV